MFDYRSKRINDLVQKYRNRDNLVLHRPHNLLVEAGLDGDPAMDHYAVASHEIKRGAFNPYIGEKLYPDVEDYVMSLILRNVQEQLGEEVVFSGEASQEVSHFLSQILPRIYPVTEEDLGRVALGVSKLILENEKLPKNEKITLKALKSCGSEYDFIASGVLTVWEERDRISRGRGYSGDVVTGERKIRATIYRHDHVYYSNRICNLVRKYTSGDDYISKSVKSGIFERTQVVPEIDARITSLVLQNVREQLGEGVTFSGRATEAVCQYVHHIVPSFDSFSKNDQNRAALGISKLILENKNLPRNKKITLEALQSCGDKSDFVASGVLTTLEERDKKARKVHRQIQAVLRDDAMVYQDRMAAPVGPRVSKSSRSEERGR